MLDRYDRLFESGQPVNIEKIGQFIPDREGNIHFIQDREINYLGDSFGLTSFVSPAIKRTALHRRIGKKISRYMESPVEKHFILPKSLKWAAILAIPIGTAAFFGVSKYDMIKDLPRESAGIILEHPFTKIGTENIAQGSKTWNVIPAKKIPVIVHSTPEIQDQTADVPAIGKNDPYAIIIGAFKFYENAQGLVESLKVKGYGASILDTTKTGLFRVSIQTFSDKDTAIQQLAMVRSSEYPAAWLLVK
jgi:hypothetical protein